MTTDTTTTLLILHEREKHKTAQATRRRKLVSTLALAATISAEIDRKEKPAKRKP